ncbi:hypothetical protein N8I77_005147 [Diaporthe amygdali]|uniref:Uncharacterized protein n=1 Tax=Phomopsis amygdali TaxID=1214568 RepID=A0AAD9SNJ4_PHOAM|nr:hypothetical protein N8I77_005147 [Diaporthe amygdali]
MESHSIWASKGLEQARFQAYVKLLRLRNGGQVSDAESFIPGANDLETYQYTIAEDADSTMQAPLAYVDDDRLKRAFLDRLAELVANVRGGRHVSASLLIESPDGVEVLVSRNSGIKNGSADWEMLKSLELKLQGLADSENLVNSSERLKDSLWELLLHVYESRIADYIHDTKQILWTIALVPNQSANSPTLETQLLDLSSLLKQKGPGSRESYNARAVSLSHQICYLYNQEDFDSIIGIKNKSRSLRDSLGYLGRLCSCHRILTLAATRLAGFSQIKIVPLEVDKETKRMNALDTWTVARAFVGLGLDLNDDNVAGIMASATGRTPWTKRRLLSKFADLKTTKHEVHAEVQIILSLTKRSKSRGTVFKYIGCSKLSCFLCYRFVKHYGSYSTRGCHGKIYDLWTVPEVHGIPKDQAAKVITSLKKTEQEVQFSIRNPNDNIQHTKESVLGSTVVSEDVSKNFSNPYAASLAARYIRSQRPNQNKVVIEPYQAQISTVETSGDELVEPAAPARSEGLSDEENRECDTFFVVLVDIVVKNVRTKCLCTIFANVLLEL